MWFRNLLKTSQFHRFNVQGHISSNSFISLIKIRSYIHSNDSFQGRMVLSVDDWDNIHHLAIWTAIFCLLRMILKEVNVFYNKFTKYHPFRQNSRAKLMHVLAKLITTKDSNKISFSLDFFTMNEPKEIWVLAMLIINFNGLFPDSYLESYYLIQIYKTSKIVLNE